MQLDDGPPARIAGQPVPRVLNRPLVPACQERDFGSGSPSLEKFGNQLHSEALRIPHVGVINVNEQQIKWGVQERKILAEVLKVAEAKVNAKSLFPTEFHKVFHGFHVVRAEYDVAPGRGSQLLCYLPERSHLGWGSAEKRGNDPGCLI